MSCDFGVWFPHERLSDEEAGALYEALCDGDTSGVKPHPALEAFLAELTAKHPQIDDVAEDQVDDVDLCPWSNEFDRSPGHVIINCVWPKADYVGQLLRDLARKHGLALFDPQAGTILHPERSSRTKPWWKLW